MKHNINLINHQVNDEYYTPPILVEIILPYVKKGSTVWCPFDTADSEFVRHRHEPLDAERIALRGLIGFCFGIIGTLPHLYLVHVIRFLHPGAIVFQTRDVERDQGCGWHGVCGVFLDDGLGLATGIAVSHWYSKQCGVLAAIQAKLHLEV